jgi:hypothetical protein
MQAVARAKDKIKKFRRKTLSGFHRKIRLEIKSYGDK